MPGINQLKKFIENLTTIGNEPEVRTKRGEPYTPLSLPANIKDVDDADDFIYSLQDPNSDGQISYGDINPENMNPDDFNLDYLMTEKSNSSEVSSFDDAGELEELSSVDSEISNVAPIFSLPEEEINLDALNDFMESEASKIHEISDFSENADVSETFEVPDNFETQENFEPAIDSTSEFEQPEIPENFDFSSTDDFEIPQSSEFQDIPENVNPLDAFNYPQEMEDFQDDNAEPFSALGNLDSLGEIENFDSEVDSEDEFSSALDLISLPSIKIEIGTRIKAKIVNAKFFKENFIFNDLLSTLFNV